MHKRLTENPLPRKKGHFSNPELDRLFQDARKSMRKGHPFQGMTTKEILREIRSN